MNLKYIYKIIDNNEWKLAQKKGFYVGSKKDLNDGFIHFSAEEQVESTLKKYFSNEKNLTLLKIDTLKLNHLIWEQTSDGSMFPHLYSVLDIQNVISNESIILNDDGAYKLVQQ